MASYPPKIEAIFMGAPPPLKVEYGNTRNDYFQQYRNDVIARMTVPRYEWGDLPISYTPHPDASVFGKKQEQYLKLPPSQFSMLDRARQQEVDNFYVLCQHHRDQYRDYSGSLHAIDYFKTADYAYQCPTDPTSKYLKIPEYYLKYKQPTVLPLTLERSLKAPSLPARALTGVYNPSSDITYKR
ncbi:hypothetical protein NQ317_004840 [Molorchus minor]|uniref:Uncharacterized protein n=1 Tax=Molorchus minor TaxID=1323400 RepID=A0ABQ9J2D2_9CUCU|nr:hypothetical protein NQ317_004840 [Molorchus minor]